MCKVRGMWFIGSIDFSPPTKRMPSQVIGFNALQVIHTGSWVSTKEQKMDQVLLHGLNQTAPTNPSKVISECSSLFPIKQGHVDHVKSEMLFVYIVSRLISL